MKWRDVLFACLVILNCGIVLNDIYSLWLRVPTLCLVMLLIWAETELRARRRHSDELDKILMQLKEINGVIKNARQTYSNGTTR